MDLAIKNARVVDGTGSPAFNADVYVDAGRIARIDTTQTAKVSARRTIDAGGRVLSPGFIDLHSHGSAKSQGAFENFISMGVTTISLGQDGFSPAVRDLATWVGEVRSGGINPNLALFLGHGTLRGMVGIEAGAQITPQQQAEMQSILKSNLPYAFGMTTGLEYSPALYAAEDELLALAQVVGNEGKLIMSHLRNEDDQALEGSLRELIRQGQFARVHVSHLKAVYGKGEARAEQILALLDAARQQGVDITADVYPYNASYTGIAIVFPDWAKTRVQLASVISSRRVELEEFIRNKVNARNGPQATLFGTDPYTGKTLQQVAAEAGKPFEQVLIDDIGPEGASAAYFVMDEALQTRLIADPMVAVSSDGSPTGFHPRGHGTFAKVIEEFVVNKQMLSLEQAIHKVSGFPASVLGLKTRGVVAEGNAADLLIFDPKLVRATATYSAPHTLATGFDYVFINGKSVLEQGKFSSAAPGKVLDPRIER
ncbi:N-acyl-D-amino-acid deacylase family protein [Biformimicrobium ophioploci]|uniref:N-acyl-D-amino-acid deacylase family protein n=1 Tax=Biformimicrobium ophioploci TaxID=3036711 RepID=UPI0025575137|nr:amidohydrolase family protein [Microbulbifer sp. NKW57]